MSAALELELAAVALRELGCTCEPGPEFAVVRQVSSGNIVHVRAHHELSCPLCPDEYRSKAE